MLRILLLGFVLAVFWAIFIGFGFHQGWFISSIAPSGDLEALSEAIESKVRESNVGNISLVVISEDEVAYELHESIGSPVSGNTVFQIASVSKWVTALGVLSLVDQGKLELDAPVSQYLTRWQFPQSEYDHDKVTLRRLLSHTSGISSFGYFGFERSDDLQTLEESLVRALDAVPSGQTLAHNQGVTRVVSQPGTAWAYTGAGYTILQLIIEEVSGEEFSTFMEKEVFAPLGMENTTFSWKRVPHENLAEFYDEDGSKAAHYIYSATAAASLYTSTSDLSRLVGAHFETETEKSGRNVLSQESLKLSRETHGKIYGIGVYGLGTFIYASNNQDDVIFGHDGSNYPAINTAVRINPTSGDAIIVFCTGNSGLATRLAGDWVLWNTGNADLISLVRVHSRKIITVVLCGWFIIAIATLVSAIRYSRRRRVS